MTTHVTGSNITRKLLPSGFYPVRHQIKEVDLADIVSQEVDLPHDIPIHPLGEVSLGVLDTTGTELPILHLRVDDPVDSPYPVLVHLGTKDRG